MTALVTGDGTELWQDLALPYTDSASACENLTRISVERVCRASIINTGQHAHVRRIGDRVTVNSVEVRLSSKISRGDPTGTSARASRLC